MKSVNKIILLAVILIIVSISSLQTLHCREITEYERNQIIEEINDLRNEISTIKDEDSLLVTYYTLAQKQTVLRRYDDAISTYQNLKTRFPYEKSKVNKIIEILEEPIDPQIILTNLGKNVNSNYNDYAPIISSDGRRIYFCRREWKDEDIYLSEKIGNIWQDAQKFTDLCSDDNEVLLALFNNETIAYLFRNGVHMKSELTQKGWSDPVPFKEYNPGNRFVYDLYFSVDNQYLFFTARDYDEYYDTDIFVCERESDGTWTEPYSIGDNINTSNSERAPFLCGDGKTLYFSSDGHPGLGGMDIFRSIKGDDGEWSEPENLGKQINGAGNDWCFKLPFFGDIGYFNSSDRFESYLDDDIFSVTLPRRLRPSESNCIYMGYVINHLGDSIQTNILIYDLVDNNKLIYKAKNGIKGDFFISLPIGRKYLITSEVPDSNWISSSIKSDRTNKDSLNRLDRIMHIENIYQSRNINLSTWFEYASWEITEDSYFELDSTVIKFLKKNPNYKISIIGHTDTSGVHHRDLSRRRANAVAEYLIKKSISRKRIKSISGKGCSDPLPCPPEMDINDCLRLNRRVEIILTMN